ncbi:MAG: DUF2306 domain-containing protein [Planctomycetota bacterium]|nr:DUF2306 domain-containing protein [Planctomycetota bacterium]MDP6739036.1 DUF2306 domain-containing protein [Planctomycetota bacterium]MDP6939136.1 DUF2306 domain-containing protein [Planctomycetota bacterium]
MNEHQQGRTGPAWYGLLFVCWLFAAYGAGVALGFVELLPAAGTPIAGRIGLFRLHTGLGALALACGPINLHRGLLARRPVWHRALGRIYVLSVYVSGTSGLVLAFVSLGGTMAHWGFGLMGVVWLVTTSIGWRAGVRRHIATHREWMLRSFATTLAAVSLRLQLTPLMMFGGSFESGYPIISFTCWAPNLILMEWWIRRTRGVKARG